MLAGNSVNWSFWSGRRRLAGLTVLVLLVVWLVAGTLRIFPHQEAFFNEVAGRWTNWSNILVDSNLDWGQDLPALRQVMEERGIERVNLAYFGKSVPEKYGVRYSPLPGFLRFVEGMELNAYNPYTPEPGWYAISATSLRLGLTLPETVNLYAYFRDLEPEARAGYSIYLYNVTYPPEVEVNREVVVGTPAAQLSAQELGIEPGERTQVKWLSSPEAQIYSFDEAYMVPKDDAFRPAGIDFSGLFTLLGYSQDPVQVEPGQSVNFALYWQVGPEPMEMPAPTRGSPLSVFLHITEEEPWQIASQFDGWPVALRGLEPGDIIVQQATVDLDEQMAPGEYNILAGLYSPQSGAR